ALEEEAELMPLGIQTSDPTITIHPLSPTPTPEPTAAPHSQMPSPPAAQLHTHNSSLTPQASLVTQLTKLREFCHALTSKTATLPRSSPQTARTKSFNFASPCGTPENPDKAHRTRLSAPLHSSDGLTPPPYLPNSPSSASTSEFESPSHIQI